MLVVAPVQGGLALLLALMINQKLRGINFFRAVYFMPVVVSIVVVSLLWRFIYAGNNGLLNNVLSWLTLRRVPPVDWLGQPSTALPAIIAMSIWQAVGFHMVIWLAGLQTISPTLYEAANIEGASRWQAFRYVTWPGLRNTAVLVLIVITMQAFALFAQIDVMTKGGPLELDADHGLPGGRARLPQAGHRGGVSDLGGAVPDRAQHLADPALPDQGEDLMATVEGKNQGLDRAWRYALLVLGAVIFIVPLLFMVMSSLKPDEQLLSDTSSLRAFLPVGDMSLSNYVAGVPAGVCGDLHLQFGAGHRGDGGAVALRLLAGRVRLRLPEVARPRSGAGHHHRHADRAVRDHRHPDADRRQQPARGCPRTGSPSAGSTATGCRSCRSWRTG